MAEDLVLLSSKPRVYNGGSRVIRKRRNHEAEQRSMTTMFTIPMEPPSPPPEVLPVLLQQPAMMLPPGMPAELHVPVLTDGALCFITVVPVLPSNRTPTPERQKILAKWRLKRAKLMNARDHADAERRKRAKGQPRDEHGTWISEEQALEKRVAELKEKLLESESQALALKAQVSTVEQELRQIQLIAPATPSGEQEEAGAQSPGVSPLPTSTSATIAPSDAPATPDAQPSQAPPASGPPSALPAARGTKRVR